MYINIEHNISWWEGGIEIESDHYWSSILSDKIKLFFIDSDEEVPLYKVGLHSLSS